MRPCSSCKGSYHPATGHVFTEKVVLCGPCARHYMKFLKEHTNRRWGKMKFYDYASTSIKPEDKPEKK